MLEIASNVLDTRHVPGLSPASQPDKAKILCSVTTTSHLKKTLRHPQALLWALGGPESTSIDGAGKK